MEKMLQTNCNHLGKRLHPRPQSQPPNISEPLNIDESAWKWNCAPAALFWGTVPSLPPIRTTWPKMHLLKMYQKIWGGPPPPPPPPLIWTKSKRWHFFWVERPRKRERVWEREKDGSTTKRLQSRWISKTSKYVCNRQRIKNLFSVVFFVFIGSENFVENPVTTLIKSFF